MRRADLNVDCRLDGSSSCCVPVCCSSSPDAAGIRRPLRGVPNWPPSGVRQMPTHCPPAPRQSFSTLLRLTRHKHSIGYLSRRSWSPVISVRQWKRGALRWCGQFFPESALHTSNMKSATVRFEIRAIQYPSSTHQIPTPYPFCAPSFSIQIPPRTLQPPTSTDLVTRHCSGLKAKMHSSAATCPFNTQSPSGWALNGYSNGYWMGTAWVLSGYWMGTEWVLSGY